MKKIKTLIGLAAVALCLGFASCSSDNDAPSYSNVAVGNSQLKTLLQGKGYTFDENGKLLLDDKANGTTSLDLSGTKLDTAALKELSVFPNLKELNLSNNGYGETFDFSVLPAQITSIDLTNNDIYNYDNLVKVTVAENGDETVENLHNITKLYLPEDAKYNMAQLVRFYRQNKSAIDGGTMDVKMQNENGVSEKYNTLREIPDATLRAYLNQETTFSGLFDGDKIDLSKKLSNAQKINNIYVNTWFFEDANLNIDDLVNLDGLQYIIENPYWEGTTIYIAPNNSLSLPKMQIGSSVTLLNLKNLDASKGLDISKATGLYYVDLMAISGMTNVDLSNNPIFGQRGTEAEQDATTGSSLYVVECEDVEEIKLPKTTNPLSLNCLDFEYLPKLKSFDINNIQMICTLNIGDLPESYNLVYPNLTTFNSSSNKTYFACSQKTMSLSSTVDFVKKYYSATTDKKLGYSINLKSKKNKAGLWLTIK